jgi:hypothetical protein
MEWPVAPGPGRLYRKLAADVATLGLPASLPAPEVVTEADLAALPDAAVRYLNFMGVAGRPPDSSFLAHFSGRFRLRPQLHSVVHARGGMDGGQRQAPALPGVSHLAPAGRIVQLRRVPLQPGRREIQRHACRTDGHGRGQCPGPLVAAAARVRNWGATGREQDGALPGDELVADPASVATPPGLGDQWRSCRAFCPR